MDAVIIIIAVILTSPFVLLIALSGRKYRKKKKQLLMNLSLLMENQNLKLAHYEICDSFIIGMDESSNTLAFYKKEETKEISRLVKLSGVSECKISVVSKDINTKNKHYSGIYLIELSLFLVDKGKPPILLEIYNSEYDSLTLTGELQVAEKWKQIINSTIASRIKVKSVKKELMSQKRWSNFSTTKKLKIKV